MNSKNRITYRFDHKGQQVDSPVNADSVPASAGDKAAQGAHKSKVVSLYPPQEPLIMSELNPWISPFQEDVTALEQLIRGTDAAPEPQHKPIQLVKSDEPAAPLEHNPFESVLLPIEDKAEDRKVLDEARSGSNGPNYAESNELIYGEEDAGKGKYKAVRYKKHSSPPSWFNVFLSVAGALATGALFGYLLLALFTGSPVLPGSGKPAEGNAPAAADTAKDPTEAEDEGVTEPGGAVPDGGGEATDTPTAALTGLDQSYYLLQFGVFSNTEGRDAALAQLRDKGFAAAAMTTKDDYRVYAGMAGDKGQAAAIKAMFPDIDLFVKEMTVSAPSEMPFDGQAESAQQFFDLTRDAVQMLDDLALAQLEQPALSKLSDAASDAWEKAYQKWKLSAAPMKEGVKIAEHKAFLDKIVLSVDTAAAAMAEYNKKPAASHLWTAQSSLMEALIAQKGWFESISAL